MPVLYRYMKPCITSINSGLGHREFGSYLGGLLLKNKNHLNMLQIIIFIT